MIYIVLLDLKQGLLVDGTLVNLDKEIVFPDGREHWLLH